MGLPIIRASDDLTSPAPILIYTPTYGLDTSKGPQSWSENVAFETEFRLIHEVKLLPGANNGLDMALVAGREGTVLIWFDEAKKKWEYNVVGTGIPRQEGNPYWGSGSVDVVRVHDDDVGYVATCEVRIRINFVQSFIGPDFWAAFRGSTEILFLYTLRISRLQKASPLSKTARFGPEWRSTISDLLIQSNTLGLFTT